MRLTKRIQVGAALVGVATLAAGIVLLTRDSNPVREDGPLQHMGRDRTGSLSLSLPVAVGKPFSTGILVIESWAEAADARRRTPRSLGAGNEAARLLRQEDPGQADHRAPRRLQADDRRAAPRVRRGAAGQLSVVVGTELAAAGEHAFRGIAVRYSADSRNYDEEFDVSLRLCAPEAKYLPHKCRTPLSTESLEH
jgi:hypothetical protein